MDRISALMDGELDEWQTQNEVSRLRQQQGARECWDTFHLIGDTLRGNRPLSAGFEQRVAERLAQEPTVLAPRRIRKLRTMTAYALSAAASLAAIALVSWVAISTHTATVRVEVAQAPLAPAVVHMPAPQLASVPDDGRTNEYILAHQGFSPSTAIQGVAPYIRGVSTTHSVVTR